MRYSEIMRLTEAQYLEERSVMRIEIKNPRGITNEVAVMHNPRRSLLLRLINEKNAGWYRGFRLPDGDVEVFDAYLATHYDIGSALGLSGMRFEIRSHKSVPEKCSMLYLPRDVYNLGTEIWRESPMVARMFPEDFHIGHLR